MTWVSGRRWIKDRFIEAAELIAAEQAGLTCLALRQLEVPASEIAAYRDWLDESKSETKSHDLWMKFGDVHDKDARNHRVIALLTYAETL